MSRNLLATTPVTSFDGTESIYVVKNGADGKATIADIANYRYIQQLQHDGYPNSDGATTNRASGIYGPFDATNNPREWIAGAASLTIAAVVTVPTSNPVSDAWYLFGYGSAVSFASNNPGIYYNSILSWLDGTGQLTINQRGASAGSYRQFIYAGFRAAYSGQTGLLKVYLVQGTTNPVVTWNGIDISSSFSLTSATPPAWLDAAMVPTYRLVGYNWPSGPAPIVTPILGATSAADDAFYLQTGKWPAWVVAGGSCANQITDLARNSVFSAAGTDWDRNANGSIAIDNANNELDVTVTGAGRTRLSEFFFGGNFATNGRYFIAVITVTNWALSSTLDVFLDVNNTPFSGALITGNGTYVLSGIHLSQNSTNSRLCIENLTGTGSYSIKSILIRFGGALSLPAVQPINVLDDVSGIGGNQGRLLGCTAVTDEKSYRILGRINAASATPQQILGGALFASPLNQALEFVDVECDGSVTLSLGDGTTATRYTALTALTAGRTRIALTTPFAADAAKTGLYVNVTVTGGTYAYFTIPGHLLK